MSLITRKAKPAASPAELQEKLRTAQAEHAAAVAAANTALLDRHDEVVSTATDRLQTIDEQVQLLRAERSALEPVAREANQPKVATR